jgi:hypothetical protein
VSTTSSTTKEELSHPRPSGFAAGTAVERALSVVPQVDTPRMGLVSPELALVDPELRAAALAALPTPSDCLSVHRPTPAARRSEPLQIVPAPAPQAQAQARASRHSIAVATVPDHPVVVPAPPPPPDAHEGRRTAATIRILAVLLCVFLCAYFLVPPLLDLL